MLLVHINNSNVYLQHMSFQLMCFSPYTIFNKVSKKAKIRHRYNQVPHLTKDTTWENDKHKRKHHKQESQEVSHFQAGDHKAAMDRQESMTNTKQKKNRLRTVSKNNLLEGLN